MTAYAEHLDRMPGQRNSGTTMQDFAVALWRRRSRVVLTAGAIVLAASAAAALLPAVYLSSATILIEQQEIPQDLVRSTVTSYADERIQVISQRVMTTANLREIVEKYRLYVEERKAQPIERVVERMRDAIHMEMVSADVVDPRSGRPTKATIAFRVGFESRIPEEALLVANELASLYLNENLKNRRRLAAAASGFLKGEADRLADEVAQLEGELAGFKERYAGALPELSPLNLQLMDRTEREIVEVERQIRMQQQNQVFLSAQLAQLEPTVESPKLARVPRVVQTRTGSQQLVDPEDQIAALETEHATLAAVYAPDHPDVLRSRRELDAMHRRFTGSTDTQAALEDRLEAIERELTEKRERYSVEHPDVKRLERARAGVRAELGATLSNPKSETRETAASNPAYVEVASRREAARVEVETLAERRAELTQRLTELERRLTTAPAVERDYRGLMRDYENALSKYSEVRAKQLEARMSEALETEQKGERFSLIEPPLLPESPIRPNRLALLFLGTALGVAGGIGHAALAESLDPAVRGPKAVERIVGEPPLAAIPLIVTAYDDRRRARRRWVASLALISVVTAAAVFVHLHITPLDVAWYGAIGHLNP